MRYEKSFVTLLLVCFAVLAVSSMAQKGLTVDELAHIPAGYTYVTEQDFRLNVEHPPLVKSLAGLSLLPLSPKLPLDHPSWEKASIDGQAQWIFGAQFFFFSVNDADTLLFWARIPVVLLGLLLGYYLWRWTRELYGPRPALFALVLFTFSPNLLAHARLVTTDMGVTAAAFITVYYWCHLLQSHDKIDAVKAGIALGLALSAKYTGVYLFLILPLLACWHATKRDQQDPWRYVRSLMRPVLVCGLTAFFTLLLVYQIVGFPAFFAGLFKVIFHSRIGHDAFLAGMRSMSGWWYYFIVTFLIKTPLAFLALVVLRLCYHRVPAFSKQTGYLLVPVIVFFAAFMFNKINIGHRHILLIYPFLYVWIAPLADVRRWRGLVAVLLVAYIAASLFIYPHYLAFFNAAVGPAHGHEWLLDSNIDWGQDLPGLKQWMLDHGVENVTMAYFGLDSRDYRTIEWQELKCRPTPGLLAVSVNRLVGISQKDAGCLEWLQEFDPIDSVGYSIRIYNISEEEAARAGDAFCKLHCDAFCETEGLALANSAYNRSCRCQCF